MGGSMHRPRPWACLLLCGCGLRTIAPASPPEQVAPAVSQHVARVPGAYPVDLDVVHRTAEADEVEGIDLQAEDDVAKLGQLRTSRLCVTPCQVNLTPGWHLLRFTDPASPGPASFAGLQVGSGPTVFRHAPGEYKTHPALQGAASGLLSIGIPIGLLSLAPLAVGQSNVSGNSSVNNTLSSVGWAGVGIGLTFIAAAVVLKLVGQDTYQPGSSTQWTLPERTVAPPPLAVPPPPPPPSPPDAPRTIPSDAGAPMDDAGAPGPT